MTLLLNGEPRAVNSATLDELIRELGLDGKAVAVERNRELVPKSRFRETELKEGDRLEIVHFVGGG
jgi:sulfur carrier protein